MNLFVLDYNLKINATYHVDKHVNKIILEASQIASTALNNLSINAPYRSTHQHLKIVKWANLRGNFEWTCLYGLSLCDEFKFRRNKGHKCQRILEYCLKLKHLLPEGQSNFVLNMPDFCKTYDPVLSYRIYYNECKRHLFKWSKRPVPYWII